MDDKDALKAALADYEPETEAGEELVNELPDSYDSIEDAITGLEEASGPGGSIPLSGMIYSSDLADRAKDWFTDLSNFLADNEGSWCPNSMDELVWAVAEQACYDLAAYLDSVKDEYVEDDYDEDDE